MPLLIFRPLIFAITEYVLAFRVFKKGHFLPIGIMFFLIFLATYQFGEYLFLSKNDRTWLAVSLFATTMLPPYGLLMIEKLSHRKTFYILFFIASLIFGLTFFFFPSVVPGARECNCFAKLDRSTLAGWNANFFTIWGTYYFVSLTFSMFLISWHILKKHGDTKNLKMLLFGFLMFFPFSYLLIEFTDLDAGTISSVMCSLAIITAFIVTHISVDKTVNLKAKVTKKRSKQKTK